MQQCWRIQQGILYPGAFGCSVFVSLEKKKKKVHQSLPSNWFHFTLQISNGEQSYSRCVQLYIYHIQIMLGHTFFPHPLISMVTFEKYLQNKTCQNGKWVDDSRTIFFKYIWTISGLWNLFKGLCCCHCLLTPQTVHRQAPLSMGCPRQERWTGLPCPSPGDLPDLGIKPMSLSWQADSSRLSHQGTAF